MNGYLEITDLVFCEEQPRCGGSMLIGGDIQSFKSDWKSEWTSGYNSHYKVEGKVISAKLDAGLAGGLAAALSDPSGKAIAEVATKIKLG